MKIDGVFSGGGVKAFVYIGALRALEEENIYFERVAGTSAGALFATLVIAGYKAEELTDLFLNLDIKQFQDESKISTVFPFIKWLSLYKTMGFYKGKQFERWIEALLESKGIKSFADLPLDRLKIVAADITLNRIIVFPDDLAVTYHINPTSFSISKALRSSISIPFFFRPSNISNPLTKTKSIIVDGMILSNFPLWVFARDGREERPILGMQLSSPKQFSDPGTINNSVDLLKAMIGTMRIATDQRYINKNIADHIIFFPVEGVESTDFDISKDTKLQLIDYGYERMKKYLSTWKNRA
ncbi:patatin-like phospholipase family protein [Gracilibacillus oryzae]|uniref:Patatin-like phospholipase family protein n=1 Tax=Gracilibacillus oryzae TaxID=1672701 RepID=A0A7C8GS72_9BACI|nr:patatin-like phospholipase family protein [Gracilibacillus oryzae]KAB8128455.1 patatin-like phospholipase family protein [Gracilibacillus oryzae]